MSYSLTPDELDILVNAPAGMDVTFCTGMRPFSKEVGTASWDRQRPKLLR
jgi:hypothetical protein